MAAISATTIVIPCRAGSTRVLNKNFRPFAGSNLLQIKIEQALEIGPSVVVNSDSPVAKEIALSMGVDFVERPKYFASGECTNSEYYQYLACSVSTENIMVLQPTAPLLKDSTVRNCYSNFALHCVQLNQGDSLVTVDQVKKFAFFRGKPINFELGNMPNSQDLEPIVIPTYNVMVAKVKNVLADKNMVTSRCLFHPITAEESLEIDTQLDFDIAEFLYARTQ